MEIMFTTNWENGPIREKCSRNKDGFSATNLGCDLISYKLVSLTQPTSLRHGNVAFISKLVLKVKILQYYILD